MCCVMSADTPQNSSVFHLFLVGISEPNRRERWQGVFNTLEGGHMTVHAGLSGLYERPSLFSSQPVCEFACFHFPHMDVTDY